MPSEQGVFTQLIEVFHKGRRPFMSVTKPRHSNSSSRPLTPLETSNLIAALQEHRLGLIRYFKCVIEHEADIGISWDEIAEEILLQCLEWNSNHVPDHFDFAYLILVGKRLILDRLRPSLCLIFQHNFVDKMEVDTFLNQLYDGFLQQNIDPYLHADWSKILIESGKMILAQRGNLNLGQAITTACDLSSAEKVREILWVVANAKCSDDFAYCILHQLRSFARIHPDIMDIISFKILMGLPDKLVVRDQAKNNGAYRQLCSDRLRKLMTYFEVCEVHLGADDAQ